MSFSHTITNTWTNGGAPIAKSVILAGGVEMNIEESIAGSSTDVQVNCPIDVSALKSIYMVADKDLTIQTNDGGSPDNTIALKANVPFVWDASSGYFPNVLTVDVVALFVTNGTADAAALQIRTLSDPTP